MSGFRYLLFGVVMVSGFAVWAEEQKNAAQQQGETELLALHQADRRAHFDHNSNALLAHCADSLLDVRVGTINRRTCEDVRAKFADYFRHANFSAWDDVEPPIVRVSSDGRMGWMIVRVRIAYTDTDSPGRKAVHYTTMAWMSAYEKRNGTWVMTAVTSTEGQPTDSAASYK
jgi:hypothetical protein